ncbi:hypothetical protein GQ600_17158 [Phytophthora cactorum]|nr:hypothetical protein GQ600_17158 [Phytophthora cactorum]
MTLPDKLENMCPQFEQIKAMFGERANVTPSATLELGAPRRDSSYDGGGGAMMSSRMSPGAVPVPAIDKYVTAKEEFTRARNPVELGSAWVVVATLVNKTEETSYSATQCKVNEYFIFKELKVWKR